MFSSFDAVCNRSAPKALEPVDITLAPQPRDNGGSLVGAGCVCFRDSILAARAHPLFDARN
jgi:hypothetical protein